MIPADWLGTSSRHHWISGEVLPDIVEALDHLASEGWELVSVVYDVGAGEFVAFLVLRPKVEPWPLSSFRVKIDLE